MFGSVIMGVGPNSSQFTDKLIRAIARGPKQNGIMAIGVYSGAQGGKVRSAIAKHAKTLRVEDISIVPTIGKEATDHVLQDLVELQLKVVRLEPESILLIVDASFISKPEYAEVFHLLRATLQQPGKMSAVCLLDDPSDPKEGRAALEQLMTFTMVSPTTFNYPILDAVFVVQNTGSPLSVAVGGTNPQMDFLARSLAQIWLANLYVTFNPTFDTQVKVARQSGHTFIGMAIGSGRLSAQQQQGFFARLRGPSLDAYQAQRQLLQLTEDLLQNRPEARTSIKQVNLDAIARNQDITVNVIAPLRISDPRFNEVRDGLQRALRKDGYRVAHTSMIPGQGATAYVDSQAQERATPSAQAPNTNTPSSPPANDNLEYAQRSYAPNDYPANDDPESYPQAGYAQRGYGAGVSTDAPTITPGNRVSGALPNSSFSEESAPMRGSDNVTLPNKKIEGKFIGQVCILFGIDPEQI